MDPRISAIPTDDDDDITGTRGRDEISALAGDDRVRGKGNDDILRGNAGEDRLFGNGGNDTLIGGADDDRLKGGGGNDKLVGGAGDDRLNGGKGRDKLIGRDGEDRLKGGEDDDLFIFKAASDGIDTIVDFDLGEGDALNLRKLLIGIDEAAPDEVVELRSDGGDTIVAVSPDADGDFTDLVRLKGEALDLQTLIDENAIHGLPSSPDQELANRPPVVDQGIDDRTANEAQSYSFDLSSDVPANAFSDPDGDPLTYSVGNPGQLHWISLDGDVLSGTPGPHSGPVLVELRATDPSGETAETTLRVNVETKRLEKSDDAQGQGEGSDNNGNEDPTVGAPIISGNGRFVTFLSQFELDRPPSEWNDTRHADNYEPYVYDFAQGGGLIRLSTFFDLANLPLASTRSVDISETGRYVAFTTDAQLSTRDPNDVHDIYRIDLANPDAAPLLISRDATGDAFVPLPPARNQLAGVEKQVAISDNGGTIVYLGADSASPDTIDIYTADVQAGSVRPLDSFAADEFDLSYVDLSGNGDVVAVAVRGEPLRVYLPEQSSPLTIDDATSPSLSDDGTRLAFTRGGNVFVRDLESGSETMVGFDETNSPFQASGTPHLAGEAPLVAFVTSPEPSDFFGLYSPDWSVFVRDLVTGDVREIPPLPGDESALLPSLSDDGEFISYLSFVEEPDDDSISTDDNVETVTHRFVDALPLYTPPPDLGVDEPVIGPPELDLPGPAVDLPSIVVDAPEVIV